MTWGPVLEVIAGAALFAGGCWCLTRRRPVALETDDAEPLDEFHREASPEWSHE